MTKPSIQTWSILALIVSSASLAKTHAQEPRNQASISVHVLADILPSGHKSILHRCVFETLELPSHLQLVAAPIRGFGGHAVIEANVPFDFSSKYGTELYLIPKSESLSEIDAKWFSQWPSSKLPVAEIASVPMWSPTDSILTTLRVEGIRADAPILSVIKHQETDARGHPTTYLRLSLLVSGSIVLGIFVIWASVRIRRRNKQPKA
jgi:hypothetical protein